MYVLGIIKDMIYGVDFTDEIEADSVEMFVCNAIEILSECEEENAEIVQKLQSGDYTVKGEETGCTVVYVDLREE